jgi:hypothetical protein
MRSRTRTLHGVHGTPYLPQNRRRHGRRHAGPVFGNAIAAEELLNPMAVAFKKSLADAG